MQYKYRIFKQKLDSKRSLTNRPNDQPGVASIMLQQSILKRSIFRGIKRSAGHVRMKRATKRMRDIERG